MLFRISPVSFLIRIDEVNLLKLVLNFPLSLIWSMKTGSLEPSIPATPISVPAHEKTRSSSERENTVLQALFAVSQVE